MMTDVLAKQMYNLTLLKAAVDAGGISRASIALGVSQPTITRGIARLEAALGHKLVERNAHGVVPTDVCRGLLRHVELATGQLAEAGAALRGMQRSRYRSLACGGSPAAMESFVPAVMHDLLGHFPNLSLQLREAQSPELLELIQAGELDIAIGARLPLDATHAVAVEPLFSDVMGVFVNADNPLLGKGVQHMQHLLTTQRWVLPEPLWAFPKSMMSDALLSNPTRVIRSHSSSAIRWYARETNFLTISTSLMLHTELNSGMVAELPTDWQFPRSEHVIYYRSARDIERPIDIAVNLFKSACADGLIGTNEILPDALNGRAADTGRAGKAWVSVNP